MAKWAITTTTETRRRKSISKVAQHAAHVINTQPTVACLLLCALPAFPLLTDNSWLCRVMFVYQYQCSDCGRATQLRFNWVRTRQQQRATTGNINKHVAAGKSVNIASLPACLPLVYPPFPAFICLLMADGDVICIADNHKTTATSYLPHKQQQQQHQHLQQQQ